jgi:hypothetical protein
MEQVADLARQEAAIPQAPEKFGLILVRRCVQTRVRRGPLCQSLAELAELDEAGARVVREVALGQRAQVIQQGVMSQKEPEVRRFRTSLRHASGSLRPSYTTCPGRTRASSAIFGGGERRPH